MTYHLHIKGRVQGVGFRPYVFKLASEKKINGYVSNEPDGVHVIFNHSSSNDAEFFAKEIISKAPSQSIITNWIVEKIPEKVFDSFTIVVADSLAETDLMVSPDFAMCPECRNEFHDVSGRRYHYPFITCTFCGPRYSIIEQLPYERHLTSMKQFGLCQECQEEYDDPRDRRFYSQTNSCPVCGIQLSWHTHEGRMEIESSEQILDEVINAFGNGKIVAVKGIGGFLLMCDASNRDAIQQLRERKHRPRKPFAVLFQDIHAVKKFTASGESTINTLLDEASPIVLLEASALSFEVLNMESIAPGLKTVGAMIPYAPILEWISSAWKKPLIATSGNVSGSSIVFQSQNKEELFQFADCILDHNREIYIPQDDSVIRFAEEAHEKIIIRRARGLAPAIITSTPCHSREIVFAAGAMLKSTFGILHRQQIILSQYLGNLASYESQQNYRHTFYHILSLLRTRPEIILADLHPDYPSTRFAEEYATEWNLPLKKIQHHEAHFAAILGEHDLFKSDEKILGVIWDGTGLGTDGNIWGGEFFIYEKGVITRVHFLEPFNNISGDKMATEPRLAALAITFNIENEKNKQFPRPGGRGQKKFIKGVQKQFPHPGGRGQLQGLESKFSPMEWNYYQKALQQKSLLNSSAG
ncbi:MAG: carbamoyltransferase HypF, partial [Saprospiraceae bacterium]